MAKQLRGGGANGTLSGDGKVWPAARLTSGRPHFLQCVAGSEDVAVGKKHPRAAERGWFTHHGGTSRTIGLIQNLAGLASVAHSEDTVEKLYRSRNCDRLIRSVGRPRNERAAVGSPARNCRAQHRLPGWQRHAICTNHGGVILPVVVARRWERPTPPKKAPLAGSNGAEVIERRKPE
jgi:hypothetical protein